MTTLEEGFSNGSSSFVSNFHSVKQTENLEEMRGIGEKLGPPHPEDTPSQRAGLDLRLLEMNRPSGWVVAELPSTLAFNAVYFTKLPHVHKLFTSSPWGSLMIGSHPHFTEEETLPRRCLPASPRVKGKFQLRIPRLEDPLVTPGVSREWSSHLLRNVLSELGIVFPLENWGNDNLWYWCFLLSILNVTSLRSCWCKNLDSELKDIWLYWSSHFFLP